MYPAPTSAAYLRVDNFGMVHGSSQRPGFRFPLLIGLVLRDATLGRVVDALAIVFLSARNPQNPQTARRFTLGRRRHSGHCVDCEVQMQIVRDSSEM